MVARCAAMGVDAHQAQANTFLYANDDIYEALKISLFL